MEQVRLFETFGDRMLIILLTDESTGKDDDDGDDDDDNDEEDVLDNPKGVKRKSEDMLDLKKMYKTE